MLLYRAYGGKIMTDYDIQLQIFEETLAERKRQDDKFGPQSYELRQRGDDVKKHFSRVRNIAKAECDYKSIVKALTWHDIIIEELYEACAEDDIEKQYHELLQTHAVILHALEDMKKKMGGINENNIDPCNATDSANVSL